MEKKAVVLLSGGLDSATTLAIATERGYAVHALSFNYGQRHAQELGAATKIADHFKVTKHMIASLDLKLFGGSALTDNSIEVPKDRKPSDMAKGIPVTYVPARNTVFLSIALGWAEVLQARDIFIGVNCQDYSGYPDCRPKFLDVFQKLANLATKGDQLNFYSINAPLLYLPKAEIIKVGLELGVPYELTRSCYDPDEEGRACGRCDSCRLRLKGFVRNKVKDPISYQ